jgi:hypothetical protein
MAHTIPNMATGARCPGGAAVGAEHPAVAILIVILIIMVTVATGAY